MQNDTKATLIETASYLLTATALLIVLQKGLVGALFAGLLVYALVHLSTPLLERKISGPRARLIAVSVLGIVVVTALSLSIWGIIAFFKSDTGNLQRLLQKMADILESSRNQLPDGMRSHLPGDVDALKDMMTGWLRDHAVEAKAFGEEAGRMTAHLLIGMVIGAMVALRDTAEKPHFLPLAAALHARAAKLSDSFQRIVFAQVRIAAINAALTAIYLLIILPLLDIHLPLRKSMVLVTFIVGMLPVIGNLISNSVLVIIALSHSLQVALASLLYLVLIHKLEYFLNARIIGSHIEARAWELLTAMLVMETVFGLPGVVAAPVLYAYIKAELMEKKLI